MAQNIRDQIHQATYQATTNNLQSKAQPKGSMDPTAVVGSASPNKYQRFTGTDVKSGDSKDGKGSSSATGGVQGQPPRIQLQPLRVLLGVDSKGAGGNSGQQFADIMGQYQEQFTIDKQEYQSVFRMFDKDNSGQISVGQVNQYIQKFEQMHLNLSNNPSSANGSNSNNAGKPEQTPKKPHGVGKNASGGGSYSKTGGAGSGPVSGQVASQLGGYHRLNKQQIVTVTSSNGNSVQSYSKGANFGAGAATNAAGGDLRMGARRVYQNSEKKAVMGQPPGSITSGTATLGKVQNGSQGTSGNGFTSNAGVSATNSSTNPQGSAAQGTSHKQRFQTERAGTQDFGPAGSQVTTAATAVSSCKPVRVLHNPNANGLQTGVNGGVGYNSNPLGQNAAANVQQNVPTMSSAQKKQQTNNNSPLKRGAQGGIGSGLTNQNQNGANGVLQLKLSQIDSSSSGTQLNVLKNGVAGGEGFQQATNNSQQNNTSDEMIFASGDKQGRRTSGAMDESGLALAGDGLITEFPNGKGHLNFDEFIEMIKESCSNVESAENYLVFAFSMFDRHKKGYITGQDLKIVFQLLGSEVSDEEINMMVKIAGVKSHDKINFKEFVDFFYKTD